LTVLDRGFDVDPQMLKMQGDAFAKMGEDFAEAADRLKKVLAELEGEELPWGADAIGGPFDVIYQPVKSGMLDSMGSLAERLQGIGGRLRTMGANYEETEALTTATYRVGG
jgi:hypothetical protein